MKIKKTSRRLSAVPVGCFAALTLLGLVLLCPISQQTANAEGTDEAGEPVAYADARAAASVSLTLSNTGTGGTITQSVTAGAVGYIATNVSVSAANVDGYQVLVQAGEGGDGSLVGQTTQTKIGGVGSNVAPANFADNKWGYAFSTTASATPSSLTYNSLPANGAAGITPAYSTTATSENKTFTLAFAAKLGTSAAADHYKSNVLVSVAAGAQETVFSRLTLGFTDITYMQEMTPTICANAKENETKQLIDKRDGKKYWITKLKDDNCWMSQNLALDLSNITLTGADSDVSSNWTPNLTSRIWGCEGNASDFECFDKTLAFYNPGSYVYTTPTVTKNCTNVDSMARCTGYGWQEVSGFTASKDPNFYSVYGNQVTSNTAYDAHFLSGNYYSWIAATANTINDSVNNSIRTATSSICPKGWRLPLSQTSNNTISKSFYYLLREYGVESKTPSTVTGYDAHLAPLFFIMAGNVTNNMFNAGASGFYMSPHTNSTNSLADFYQDWDYGLNVTASAMNPSATTGRYYGQSVRCVAR